MVIKFQKLIVSYINWISTNITSKFLFGDYLLYIFLSVFPILLYNQFKNNIFIIILLLYFSYPIILYLYKCLTSVIFLTFTIFISNIIFLLLVLSYVDMSNIYQIIKYMFFYTLFCNIISVMADTRVSMLANEIIATVTGFLFTVVSFILSFISNKIIVNFISNKLEDQYINSFENFLKTLESYGYNLADIVKFIPVIFLPIIGVSTLSIIFVKIRKYFLENNDIEEPKIRIDNNNKLITKTKNKILEILNNKAKIFSFLVVLIIFIISILTSNK